MPHPQSTLMAFGDGRQKLRIGLLLLDNFTLNALSGFIDALRLAADTGGRSRQIDCGWVIMGKGMVRASCGLAISPDSEPLPPARFDYLAVVGGNDYAERVQPAWVTAYLQETAAAGIPLIGLCTGTFNIARAGLMQGVTACLHWNVHQEFAAQFPKVRAISDRIFLDTGNRITCAGSTGAPDLALHLIDRHCGPERAQQSLRHMVLNDQREASYPQAQFSPEARDIHDDLVRRAVVIMEQTLNDPISIDRLATRLGISGRQMARRFAASLDQTPSQYYRFLRIRYGAWRLIHSTDLISDIAADSGFCDASHFQREFRGHYGVSPAKYRKGAIASA
ncbi:GlxA family transcriptional regulator [Roseovarius pelagicus]|uniref:GlxA family transcriptional regulator n=1 Tax=Roseovarius pelagicus TaxID=2980108 RepID=A0ABY6D8W0_9RHOB|nr:GlxA family transcriptional regulator [Roseovarius pelagicus]UXX82566.1 GlxA family transcriptional regulator [Roseovarius pelagicus]